MFIFYLIAALFQWMKRIFNNLLLYPRTRALAPPLAPPPATQATHPSNQCPAIPHPSLCLSNQHPAIPHPVRHLRTRSWAWEERCSRPSLRVTNTFFHTFNLPWQNKTLSSLFKNRLNTPENIKAQMWDLRFCSSI